MQRFIGLLLILLSSCSLFQEAEENVKYYVYINSNSLFMEPIGALASGSHPAIFVEDVNNPGLIKSLSFKTFDGSFVYNVDVKKIYNYNYVVGAGDSEPFEIPNKDYMKMSITTADVIKKIRFNNDGTYTILEKGPINAEYLIQGVSGANTMDNYDAFTSPSGKKYGDDTFVKRIDLSAYTDVLNSGDNENSYSYNLGTDAFVLNPPKGSTGGGSCFIGKWKRSICNGTQTAFIEFKSNSTGNITDKDCTGACVRTFNFNYKAISSSELQIDYTSGSICGSPSKPTGGKQTYSCTNSNTLIVGKDTYIKVN